jgi:hypothetical protein
MYGEIHAVVRASACFTERSKSKPNFIFLKYRILFLIEATY